MRKLYIKNYREEHLYYCSVNKLDTINPNRRSLMGKIRELLNVEALKAETKRRS